MNTSAGATVHERGLVGGRAGKQSYRACREVSGN
jgi:hypothetical protein